jgi:hypothetical protein
VSVARIVAVTSLGLVEGRQVEATADEKIEGKKAP